MLISFLNQSVALGLYPKTLAQSTPLKQLTQQLKSLTGLRGANLKLSQIRNSNLLMISSALYFLTLECSDGCFYEAKIDMKFRGEGRELVMFRPAKYFPRPRYYYLKTNEVEGQSSLIFQSCSSLVILCC
ncbi:hypothetical protein Dsin_011741 [Dipteronia sinensis]|uniref:Uncharacterized protein n=1 Tax=Dipteronia sinensis TaxID=43782 RepID=A0AAE0AGZ2_9ROSI|nr:hypothetical protein Dsin_011741 [Dipteronia sinensis]